MDKEEAMKILKDFHDKSALFSVRTALETLHPELKDSEDEKTRKALISFLKSPFVNENITDKKVTPWLAWLEKQGEPFKWNKNTEGNKPQVNHSVLMKTTHSIAEGEWKGEYWEQYRWSNIIKDSDVLSWMELSDLDKQGEQKPAWSEEDTIKIHNLITLVKCGGSIKTDLRDEYEDWLKSLRPQPKQEWSEEDEMTIKILIGLVETYFCGCIDKSEKNRVLDWLKSLKQRIGG